MDADIGESLFEIGGGIPVNRAGLSVEEAGRCKEECARAGGGDLGAVVVLLCDPGDEFGIVSDHVVVVISYSGYDQQVGLGHIFKQSVGFYHVFAAIGRYIFI